MSKVGQNEKNNIVQNKLKNFLPLYVIDTCRTYQGKRREKETDSQQQSAFGLTIKITTETLSFI